MFKGGWRNYFAAGAGLGIAIGAALLIGTLFANSMQSTQLSSGLYNYEQYVRDAVTWSNAARQKSDDQHDALDLAAQWASAEAAQRMVFWTIVQVTFGVFGFAVLIYSLRLNRKATAAAIQAVEVAEDTAKRELRAYLALAPKRIGGFVVGNKVNFEFSPNNHGQTPASRVHHLFEIKVLPHPLPLNFKYPTPTREVKNETTVFPNSDQISWFIGEQDITENKLNNVREDKARLHCWGMTFYHDVFNKKWSVKFFVSMGGADFVSNQAAYHAGVTTGLPSWRWEFGSGHGETTSEPI